MINCWVELGDVSSSTKEEIASSFARRISPIDTPSLNATVIINPDLGHYEDMEAISTTKRRYLIDSKNLVSQIVLIRLASFDTPQEVHSLLFIFDEKVMENHQKLVSYGIDYIRKEQMEEINFICQDFRLIENPTTPYILCVSGERGIGKTYFAHKLIENLHCSNVYYLDYYNIQGENADAISKNTSKFFKCVEKNSAILIENADSFLQEKSANFYVKNSLTYYLLSRKDLFVIVETRNPCEIHSGITKFFSYSVLIHPLEKDEKYEILNNFLKTINLTIDRLAFDNLPTATFQIAEIVEIVRFAKLYLSIGYNDTMAINEACKKVIEVQNNLFSAPSSNLKAVSPKYVLNDVILPEEKKEKVKYAASLIKNMHKVYDVWNFKSIDPYPRSILNFYGVPGTGKTMCAHAIARMLGKELLALNYAEIESKYIGDAPKNLEGAFAFAAKHNLVMFFDEADSFLGKRIEDVSHSADQALNSLRSTMLIQLEMFNGVVIFASNLRSNYDKAFMSRFLYEIEFDLPNEECREKLIRSFCDKIPIVDFDTFTKEEISELVIASEGLAGRDIKNSLLDALNRMAYEKGDDNDAKLSYKSLLSSIKERTANKESLNVIVKNDVSNDKERIGEALKATYGDNDDNNNSHNESYALLLQTACYAAWADGTIQEEESKMLFKTAKELNMDIPNLNTKDSLIPLDDLVSMIIDRNLQSQSIEIAARIIAADSVYTAEESAFLMDFSNRLGLDCKTQEEVNHLIELMVCENKILSAI